MSGYHYPPNQHLPPQYYAVGPNGLPNISPSGIPHVNLGAMPQMMAPDGSMPMGMSYVPQFTDAPLQQGFIDQYEDVSGPIGALPGGTVRMRRRSAPGEHVKHRRTRSGCFTCRNRRVKCDETRPICERCRKGSRECVYPEPQEKTKAGRSGSKSSQKLLHDSGSSPEDHTGDSKDALAMIPDDEEDLEFEAAPLSATVPGRDPSDTPSLIQDRSPSPSTESSATITTSAPRPPLSRTASNQTSMQGSSGTRSFADLPQDVKFYLDYHQMQISYHHYSFKADPGNFLKTTFIEMAIKHEPLMYAVVGFAAYYHTLSKPDGKISTFLQYYNKSVSLLRQSLQRSKKHSLSTLMTILQLASIEELLGDWLNLAGHQRAACQILTRLYTPQSMMTTEIQRKVLLWYIRFDLFVGLQSGGESVLPREWFAAMKEYYDSELQKSPHKMAAKYEARFASSRLLACDTCIIFGKKAKGLIPDDDEFEAQLNDINKRLSDLLNNVDPALVDPSGYVTDLAVTSSPDTNDIVNPYEPNVIFKDQQWTSNFIFLDVWGIEFMYRIQLMNIGRATLTDPEIEKKAYRTAQIFRAITLYPHAPPGAMLEAQATLAIATLFLPKTTENIQWCLRMFCKVEAAGYIYSISLRDRLLAWWGLSPSDWWLPNDEGCPPIIRSIKNFIVERNSQPRDQTSEDLAEMKGIFNKMTLSDTPSPDRRSDGSVEGGMSVSASIDETYHYTGLSPEYEWSPDQDSKYVGSGHYGAG